MPLQTTVHLTRVHITLAGNSPDGVVAGSAGSIGGGGARGENRSIDGEFRTYANGVTRLLLGTGRHRTSSLALRALTPDQLAEVHDLAGKTCLFRDTYGAHFYGAFLVLDETTLPLSGVLTDVGLQITEVNYTEGV